MKSTSFLFLALMMSVVTAMFIASCDDDTELPAEIDTGYFPLEVGSYIIYQVDSIVYDDFNDTVIERTLEVREIVESVFSDAGGGESYRIERQYRNNEGEVWGSVGYDIWFASFDGNNAERIEENQRYIKIAFPAREGKTWPGNIHINVDPEGPLGYLEGWEYSIVTVDQSAVVGGQQFDSTMTVIEQSSGTAIDTVGSRSVYAHNIGLVSRELWVLESQCSDCAPGDTQCIDSCFSLPWLQKAEKGFVVKQTILAYGNL
jgi:hypothetical protein